MPNFAMNSRGGFIIPENTALKAGTQVPSFSELGNGCTLGDECKLGNWCTLGNGCTLGVWCTLGDECTLGESCTLENVICLQFLTMANVDGTGRQLLVIKHPDGVRVRAGCFAGTGAEFLVKAGAEGKTQYVAIVGAVINAMADAPIHN